MVYLRSKKVKGDQYLYLVRSVWDPKRTSSKQEIIKYLGKASNVKKSDLPKKYRNDPKISSFLFSHSSKKEKTNSKFQNNLYKLLKRGDLAGSFDLYKRYKKYSNTTDFFEQILKPVMYKVGDLWAKNEISIADEHVCSNTALNLLNVIMQQKTFSDKKRKILLCTPTGEEHYLGCKMIESFLVCKGYNVFNLAPSVPSESIIEFIEDNKPDFVFVSITLDDNLQTGQRLVKKIKENFDIHVLVGGQAIFNNKNIKFDGEIFDQFSLDSIAKRIRNQ